MDTLIRALLTNHVTAIEVFERRALAIEGSETPVTAPGAPAAGAKKPKAPLLSHETLRVVFRGEAGSVRAVLNNIVNSKIFFIVRSFAVTSEGIKGPQRGVGSSGAAPGATPGLSAVFSGGSGGGEAKADGKDGRLQFILGKEKITTEMLIEIPDFAEPEASPAPKNAEAAPAR